MNEQDEGDGLLSRSDAVATLASFREEHLGLLRQATAGSTDGLRAEDHLVIAALVRSLANIDGFLAMVDQGNKFCAIPIVRSQLDSAMRVFACILVDDPHAFGEHLLHGNQPGKFKDRDGERLLEGYLKGKLAEKHEHADEVYSYTSGFAHLSNHHLFGVLDLEESQKGTLAFVDFEGLPPWPEREIRSALVEFVWATDILLDVCKGWREGKAAREARPS